MGYEIPRADFSRFVSVSVGSICTVHMKLEHIVTAKQLRVFSI
jgi:hypothetical protein